MTIYFEYEAEQKLDFDYEKLVTQVVCQALEYEKCPYETELSVVFTDNIKIQQINNEYRQIDAPTDVLSFPAIEFQKPSDFSDTESYAESCFNPESGELILGDVMVSIDKAMEQAELYGHSLQRELAFLIAHSMLHLCGYDHISEEERSIMEEKQEEILTSLNIVRK